MPLSDDDTDRLNLLNHNLTELMGESLRLRQRWMAAAVDAQTWPDTYFATQLFISLQHVSQKLRDDR